ncbi:MAG: GFA family protein [Polaromonas sp.]|nr:GFA family protein [Polaromonas sp.]MDP3750492.1 GFA family protein [Polaromonas sp.]
MTTQHHGSCLCEGVRFTIEGELARIEICHCSQCRRAQGSAFGANIPVETVKLKFLSGLDLLHRYASSSGKTRAFCSICGSPVLSERSSLPGVVRIRAGLLAEPIAAEVESHAYVDSKASWWSIGDGLTQHPEGI